MRRNAKFKTQKEISIPFSTRRHAEWHINFSFVDNSVYVFIVASAIKLGFFRKKREETETREVAVETVSHDDGFESLFLTFPPSCAGPIDGAGGN